MKLNPIYFSKDAIWVSSFQKKTIEKLRQSIETFFKESFIEKKYSIPYTANKEISEIYKKAIIKSIQQKEKTINFTVLIPKKLAKLSI